MMSQGGIRHFSEQQPKKTRLSDEEKMHYVLQYYSTPLINGKMKTFSKFLNENNITKKGATIHRVWEASSLMNLREKGVSMLQASLLIFNRQKSRRKR